MFYRVKTLCSVIATVFVLGVVAPLAAGDQLSDDQLESVGRKFADAINRADAEALGKLFSWESMAEKTAATVTDSEREKEGFKRGFLSAAKNIPQDLIQQIHSQQGAAKYLRIREVEGIRGPLLRYDLEEGHNYVVLSVVDIPGSGLHVDDMYIATNGEKFSQTMGAISQLMVSPSKDLLDKLFNKSAVDKTVVDSFSRIGDARRQGNFPEAYKILSQLPPAMRSERLISTITVQIAGMINEETYRRELARLARNHSDDPTLAFTLIDHYFYVEDFEGAMNAIDNMEKTFGEDAAIEIMRANIEVSRDDMPAASRYASNAISLEPDHEWAYWTLLSIQVMGSENAGAVETIKALDNNFGYALDPESMKTDEFYAEFAQSPEFEKWAAEY